MKFPAAILTLFLTLVVVNASTHGYDRSLGTRNWHSRRQVSARTSPLEKKSPQRRCARRNKPATTSSSKKHTSTKAAEKTLAPKPPKKDDNNYSGGGSPAGHIFQGTSQCGSSHAVAKTTKDKGPNGSIYFLNCGIDGSGWNPPRMHINDVVVKSLSDAIQSPSSPFHACKDFVKYFNKYGGQYNIPPILLASFAMQESSCKPNTIGGAGEQGLMQITKDKCGGAPGGNCRDPDFNIRTGAKYFAQTLDEVGGNVLEAIGRYNGWSRGLTIKKATSIKHQCCRCQQNLDYLHQFLNGWCQNINAYDMKLGVYDNLKDCPIG